MTSLMDHVKHLRDLLCRAEEYVIDGVTKAKEDAEMNAAYPMRSPRFDAALEEVRRLHAQISTVLRTPTPTEPRQPTPGVYENYREPGEFGEGVTVRQTPAPVQHLVGWQDISTAPRDGSEILAWNGRRRHVAHFDKIEGEWVSSFKTTTKRLIVTPPPTHWSPLPTEPATTEGQPSPRNPQQSHHTEKYDGID